MQLRSIIDIDPPQGRDREGLLWRSNLEPRLLLPTRRHSGDMVQKNWIGDVIPVTSLRKATGSKN